MAAHVQTTSHHAEDIVQLNLIRVAVDLLELVAMSVAQVFQRSATRNSSKDRSPVHILISFIQGLDGRPLELGKNEDASVIVH